jgi:hypothetical protein
MHERKPVRLSKPTRHCRQRASAWDSLLWSACDSAMMPILERERRLADLAAWWSEVCAGNGRVVLIAAEAGIGKTALIRELQRQISGRKLLGMCDPISAPLARAARRHHSGDRRYRGRAGRGRRPRRRDLRRAGGRSHGCGSSDSARDRGHPLGRCVVARSAAASGAARALSGDLAGLRERERSVAPKRDGNVPYRSMQNKDSKRVLV